VHVSLSGLQFVGMTVFENDFRITYWKPVHVGDTPTQDERVVVESEIRSVAEDDFAYFRPLVGAGISDESYAELFAVCLTILPKSLKLCTEVKGSGFRISFASR